MSSSTLLQLTTQKKFALRSTAKSPPYLPDIEGINASTVSLIQEELRSLNGRWFLGFSGGKDSSALLKLTYLALASMSESCRPTVTVVYCDTGVDMPIVARLVRRTLKMLQAEA